MKKYQDGYKTLNVYQKAEKLAFITYQITSKFPKSELFGLVSQMRRSAISVVANIVEGWARKTKLDKIRFYYMSRGSLTELEFYIDFSLKLKFISRFDYDLLNKTRIDVAKLLKGFINAQER